MTSSGPRQGSEASYEEAFEAYLRDGPRRMRSNDQRGWKEAYTPVQDTRENLIQGQRAYLRSLVTLGVSIMLLLITLALLWTPVLGSFHGTS